LLAADKGRAGESYLLGGENVSMKELAHAVQRVAFGRERWVMIVPGPILSCVAWLATAVANGWTHRAPEVTPEAVRCGALGGRADITKARTELGLTTRPLEDSIRDALSFWVAREGFFTSGSRKRLQRRLEECVQ
jgi:dihydroflavonol-4-reductase